MSRPTLLLVEENPQFEGGLRRAIQKNNVANEALIACDVNTAQAFFEDHDEDNAVGLQPTLILVEASDSREDTCGLLRHIKNALGSRAPAIVAFLDEERGEDHQTLRDAGAASVVLAPRDASKREELVLDVLTYWLTLDAGAASPEYAHIGRR